MKRPLESVAKKEMGVGNAAKAFDVPKATLQRKLKKKKEYNINVDSATVLKKHQRSLGRFRNPLS